MSDNDGLLTMLQVGCALGAVVVIIFVVLAKRGLASTTSTPPLITTTTSTPPAMPFFAADSGTTDIALPPVLPQPTIAGVADGDSPAGAVITPEDYAWWQIVVERAPHVLLVGDTDSGKTTTARALAKERSYVGKVLVIDPNATPDRWGVPAIGAGHKFDEIGRIMQALNRELSRRYAERAQGITNHEPLTIVVDEMNLITDKCGDPAKEFLKLTARSGREAHMRLVMLAQSDRVKALNVEGEGDIREQFATIRLGYKARDRFPEKLAGVERPAALQYKAFDGPVSVFFMQFYSQLQFNLDNVLTQQTLGLVVADANNKPQSRQEGMTLAVQNFVETTEKEPKQVSASETCFSALETPGNALSGFSRNDFQAAAKVIKAGLAGETKVLETVFGVKPGGSAAYQEARQRLREAQEQLEKEEGK